ncbi:hypothetical protein EV714DRAFT_275071 [Schizophyllum commune]
MPDDPLAVLWLRAVKRYESLTRVDLSAAKEFTSAEDICRYLEQQNEGHKQFAQGTPADLLHRFQPFAGTLESLCGLIGDGVGLAVPAGKLVFSAVGILLKSIPSRNPCPGYAVGYT